MDFVNKFESTSRCFILVSYYFITVLLIGVTSENSDSVVTVEQGKLRGSVQKLLDGRSYFSFKGIPYAQPPVGELRFRVSFVDEGAKEVSLVTDYINTLGLSNGHYKFKKIKSTKLQRKVYAVDISAPLPPHPWTGIREATEHGPICPQYDLNTNQIVNGSEDCLFLNVYTRSITANSKTPVMVYIYGGGFMSGSGNQGSYGPELLLQHNVVMVTFNYRLEVLGFLSLDTPEVPGNAGMKDQVLALRWVKENIANLGGDPDNVTIFGESAGSVAVTYHIISPMSKGLFHRAIAQSGVCIDDSGITTEMKERAFRVGKVLGKETTDTQELLRFLKSIPAIKLGNMTFVTETADEKLRGVPMRFGPVVEKKFHNIEAFISEDPLNLIVSKKVNNVPLIIGYNSAEGLIMLADQLKKAELLNSNASYLVPRELVRKVSERKVKELGEEIMKFYTGDKGMRNDTAQGIVEMRTDMHFSYNIHRFAYLYSFEAPVYMYRFDYDTELNIVKRFIGLTSMSGACHADDLFYLFYNELNREIYTSQEKLRRIVFDLTKLWTDFAKTGSPTSVCSSMKWPKYSSAGHEYMALNEVMTSSYRADSHRVNFWNQMYCDAGAPCIDHVDVKEGSEPN